MSRFIRVTFPMPGETRDGMRAFARFLRTMPDVRHVVDSGIVNESFARVLEINIEPWLELLAIDANKITQAGRDRISFYYTLWSSQRAQTYKAFIQQDS